MDSSEFSSQLAEFSSLEQLFNINDNLETLQDVQDNGNRFQALELIGKEVKMDGNMLSLEEDTIPSGGFTLNSAADCSVFVYDENGDPVREISLGILETGHHSFEWDGRNEDGVMMDPDVYGFRIGALTEKGQSLNVETQIIGLVDRVELTGEDPLLYIGDIYLNLSQVTDISLPKSTVNTGAEQD
jgi:flagellar basal-body rod modification protein FlgD